MTMQVNKADELLSRPGIPPLASATFCVDIATPRNHAIDWRICVGMRGFLGRRLDGGSKSLKNFLLPVFHEHHDRPAPFRLTLEESDSCEGVHRLRILTFGPESKLIIECFADLWRGAVGNLNVGESHIPFETLQLEEIEGGNLLFPEMERPLLSGVSSSVELVSTSPFFSRTKAETLFCDGRWTDLLAIRFADLGGLRRQWLRGRLPAIIADGEVQSETFHLALGGRRKPESGYFFRVVFPQADATTSACLELLRCLGLGKHCAYGAGAFRLDYEE